MTNGLSAFDSKFTASATAASNGLEIGGRGTTILFGRQIVLDFRNKSPGRSKNATPGRPYIVALTAFSTHSGTASKDAGLAANFEYNLQLST
jgi:hypothetical protein